ncbi:MAG: hypothetical protein ACOCX3_02395 [Chloroflexota bacterium]
MTRRKGLTDADWQALKREMRNILIGLARIEQTIAYSELAAQLRTAYIHYRAPAFGAILREIAEDDEAAGRPSLATLVVNKATGRPGGGYFKHAGSSGANVSDLEAYWQARFRSVCDYWQNND